MLGESSLKATLVDLKGGGLWEAGSPCGMQREVQRGTPPFPRTTKQTVKSHEHTSVRWPFPP